MFLHMTWGCDNPRISLFHKKNDLNISNDFFLHFMKKLQKNRIPRFKTWRHSLYYAFYFMKIGLEMDVRRNDELGVLQMTHFFGLLGRRKNDVFCIKFAINEKLLVQSQPNFRTIFLKCFLKYVENIMTIELQLLTLQWCKVAKVGKSDHVKSRKRPVATTLMSVEDRAQIWR